MSRVGRVFTLKALCSTTLLGYFRRDRALASEACHSGGPAILNSGDSS